MSEMVEAAVIGETKHLQILNRVSLLLTSTLDPSKMFETVVQTAIELFGNAAASLWIVDRDGHEVTLVADAGLRHPDSRARRTLRLGEGLVGRVVQARRPVVLDDLEGDTTRVNRAMDRREGFRSVASIPLLFGDHCFGALTVRRRTDDAFRPEDVDLLIGLGNHAAIALENARLHEARELRATRLRTLTELNRLISSSLDADEVLGRIAAAAADLTGTTVVEIWIADEAARMLRLSACSNRAVGGDKRLTTLAYGHGGVGWVAEHRERLELADVYSDPRIRAPEWFKVHGLTSGGWLPIVFHSELLGVVSLLDRKPVHLAGDNLELIDGFVGQAAVAIRNARLFAASERRRQTAEALAEVGRTLAQSLDRDAVARRIVESVRALFHCKTAVLYALDPETGDLSLVASAHPALDWHRVVPRGTATVGRAALERRAIVTADVLADPATTFEPRTRAGIEAAGYRAALAVPLVVQERVIGVLTALDEAGRVFAADEVRLLETFADQAVIAMENARLYAEAQARAARMTRLSELSQLMSVSLDTQRIVDFVIDAARDLVDADLATLWAVDDKRGLVRLATRSRNGDGVQSGMKTQLDRAGSATGWVIERKAIYYSPNVLDDPRWLNKEWARRTGHVSAVIVPLLVGDRAVGALTVMTKALRRFSRDEQELLELFAGKAAAALANARLYADVQAQAAALQAKNAELDSFTYVVSHDLKAPLVAIHGLASMLVSDQADRLDERGRRYLGRIATNVAHMERLIGDLLTLSRVGREAAPSETVVVDEVVDEALHGLAEAVQARGVTVSRAALGTVTAIRTQMVQIWTNLITNAVKYLGDTPAPAIAIGCVDRGDAVEYSVRDNGIGIDPAYHAKVFEMFQRLHDVEADGTGVGLPIVKKIVEAAGGRLGVESAKGQGATFFFTWPKTRSEP